MTIYEFERLGYVPIIHAVKDGEVIVWDGSAEMRGEIAREYIAEGFRVRICREPQKIPRVYEWVTE
jgi:hypothetical protein